MIARLIMATVSFFTLLMWYKVDSGQLNISSQALMSHIAGQWISTVVTIYKLFIIVFNNIDSEFPFLKKNRLKIYNHVILNKINPYFFNISPLNRLVWVIWLAYLPIIVVNTGCKRSTLLDINIYNQHLCSNLLNIYRSALKYCLLTSLGFLVEQRALH